ncbi:MAG: MFS transporter [Betaproteobacteria bacterium]|nr:MFS transporter [Betaproteobacteria bacterium]
MTLRLIIVLTVLAHVGFVGSRVTVSLHAIALGASPLTVGVLMSLYAALPMLLAVHAGRRIDRAGVAGPLFAGLLAVSAGVLLPAAWPSLGALFFAATLIGTGFLFVHVALNNVVGALAAPEARAVSFAWLALGFSVGGFFGPLAAGFAIDGLGHRLAFLVLAVFPGIAAAILWQRRRRLPAHAAPKPDGGERNLADLLRDPRLRQAFIASAVLAMGWDLYAFVVPIYGTRIGLSASLIGIVMGTFSAATFAVRLALPAMARRVREWPMVAAAMIIASVSYALFPLAQSVAPLMALSFLLGLGLGCAQPFIMSLLYAASPPGRQGEVIGIRTTLLSGSHTVLPLAMGALGAALGMAPVFWSMALVMLAGGVIAGRRVK